MESIQQVRPTIAEIDAHALASNFRELSRILRRGAGMLPVIKSDAYGHGLVGVARTLRAAGADRFAVATVAEAEALRAAGIDVPAVVLGGVYPAEHERIVAKRVTPVIWDLETGQALAAAARTGGRPVTVHVKVDTGMSRLGVAPADAAGLLRSLGRLDGLVVEGLLTHFCNAESIAGVETARQLERFHRLVRELDEAGLRPPLVHAANSAATLAAPDAHFDVVRPGLALYGAYPADSMRGHATVRPVMRLVTRIVTLRSVAAGVGVSYGSTWVAARPSVIATLPIGYADGYPRGLSGRGVVVVRGGRAPVAGRVCMDHTMIDVTDVPQAAVGDEVVLWGAALPVEEVAATAETIPYELLARVGPRVPRVLV